MARRPESHVTSRRTSPVPEDGEFSGLAVAAVRTGSADVRPGAGDECGTVAPESKKYSTDRFYS